MLHCIMSFYLPGNPSHTSFYRWGDGLREMKWLAQVHIAGKWQREDLNHFHQFLIFKLFSFLRKWSSNLGTYPWWQILKESPTDFKYNTQSPPPPSQTQLMGPGNTISNKSSVTSSWWKWCIRYEKLCSHMMVQLHLGTWRAWEKNHSM